jgi:hypothetical protein
MGGVLFLLLGLLIDVFIGYWFFPLAAGPDVIVSALAAGIVVLLHLVLGLSMGEPVLGSPIAIRRTLLLGYISDAEAQTQYEMLCMGTKVKDLLSDDMEKYLRTHNGLTVTYKNIVTDMDRLRRLQRRILQKPGRKNHAKYDEGNAIVKEILDHHNPAERSFAENRKLGIGIRGKPGVMRTMSPRSGNRNTGDPGEDSAPGSPIGRSAGCRRREN